jgi:hypothetical protein
LRLAKFDNAETSSTQRRIKAKDHRVTGVIASWRRLDNG